MRTRVRLGECGVDSGQILLVDPCYVENGLDYNDVCCSHDVGCDHTKDHDWHTHQTYHEGYGGQVQSIKGDGVVVGRFGGDGVFPVYAHIVNGEVRSVEIRFDIDGDEDEGSIL